MTDFARVCAAAVDWNAALRMYRWKGDWRAGLTTRRQLAGDLMSAGSSEAWQAAVDAITNWGGVPLLRGSALSLTRASLTSLDRLREGEVRRASDIFGHRIATVSKVYAMHDLDRWTIYDSRVAWTLEAIKAVLIERGRVDEVPAPFHQPPGRTAPGFRGVPRVRTDAHGRDSFLRGSELLYTIARHVPQPCPDEGGWRVVHLEMAAFALGDPNLRGEVPMTDIPARAGKRRRVPTAGRIAKDAARSAVQSDFVKSAVEEQLSAALLQQFAKAQAMRFARQTDSVAARVQFSDGVQRWVVFNQETPIAAFPPFGGDLDETLRFHNLERLNMQQPGELADEIERDRDKRRNRWRVWARNRGEDEETLVQGLLELEAGDT